MHIPDRTPGQHLGGGSGPQSLVWDATIGSDANGPGGGSISAFASEGDDLYLAGDYLDFDTVARASMIVHYNKVTGQWNGLDYGPFNVVNAVAVHNGKVYIAGNFNQVGGLARLSVGYIAMWDGTQWQDVGGGFNDVVNALVFIGDDLYAGGDFTTAGGADAHYLAKWDGSSWQEVGGGTSYPVQTLYATHDSLYVGGSFNYVGGLSHSTGQDAYGIALYHHGTWTTYGSGFDGTVYAIAIHNGTLWAGGDFFDDGTFSKHMNALASWNGAEWVAATTVESFGSINSLLSVDGVLYAAGLFDNIGGASARSVAVLKNGTWSELAGGLYGYGDALAAFDGKIYVGGSFDRAGSTAVQGIAILDPATQSWSTIGKGAYTGWRNDLVRAIATTGNLVYAAGNFRTMAGLRANHIAVYNRLTHRWSALGAGLNGYAAALSVVGDNVYVAGGFDRAGDVPVRNIAVWNATTSTWSDVARGGRAFIHALTNDGTNVYACTGFGTTGSSWYRQIGKWNGTSWESLPGQILGNVYSLATRDGSLFAAGDIRQIDGVDMNGIAQFDGSAWSPLGDGFSNSPEAITFSQGTLYATGHFANADGQRVNGLAFWDGSTWNGMGSGFDQPGYALAADGKGGVYVGGDFTKANGVDAAHLVHWDGTDLTELAGGVNRTVIALATDPTSLYVGGWLFEVGTSSMTSNHIAALRGAGADVIQSLSAATKLSVHSGNGILTVTMSLDRAQGMTIQVFDMLGRSIAASGSIAPSASPTIDFNTRSWAAGAYAIHASTPDGHSITTIVSIVK